RRTVGRIRRIGCFVLHVMHGAVHLLHQFVAPVEQDALEVLLLGFVHVLLALFHLIGDEGLVDGPGDGACVACSFGDRGHGGFGCCFGVHSHAGIGYGFRGLGRGRLRHVLAGISCFDDSRFCASFRSGCRCHLRLLLGLRCCGHYLGFGRGGYGLGASLARRFRRRSGFRRCGLGLCFGHGRFRFRCARRLGDGLRGRLGGFHGLGVLGRSGCRFTLGSSPCFSRFLGNRFFGSCCFRRSFLLGIGFLDGGGFRRSLLLRCSLGSGRLLRGDLLGDGSLPCSRGVRLHHF